MYSEKKVKLELAKDHDDYDRWWTTYKQQNNITIDPRKLTVYCSPMSRKKEEPEPELYLNLLGDLL